MLERSAGAIRSILSRVEDREGGESRPLLVAPAEALTYYPARACYEAVSRTLTRSRLVRIAWCTNAACKAALAVFVRWLMRDVKDKRGASRGRVGGWTNPLETLIDGITWHMLNTRSCPGFKYVLPCSFLAS